jgi:N-acyl-D-amino-acid deacylase
MECDLVLRGGTVVTGTDAPTRACDIGIRDGMIVAVAAPGTLAGEVIAIEGRHVVPGFIDIHSHADYTMLLDGRAHSAVMQGITSIVVGNCGLGLAPVTPRSAALIKGNAPGWRVAGGLEVTWTSFADYLAQLRDGGVGPNVFPLVAHGALRLAVAGFEDRAVTDDEIAVMRACLSDAMDQGAVGFSTGLEYAPGIASTCAELTAVAEGMRGRDGIYATHCRNRSHAMADAAREAIAVARAGGARLQLSHFIRRPYADPAVADETWREIARARDEGLTVLADVFPFEYGPTPLSVLLPATLRARIDTDPVRHLGDPDLRATVLAGLGGMFGAAVSNGLADTMHIACDGLDGTDNGKTLPEIAAREGLDLGEAAYWLLQRAGVDYGTVMIVENWVRWEDLLDALADPSFLIMGDGATGTLDGAGAHFDMCPSDWGYTARFLSRFVRDMGLCSLEDAVARMAVMPARQLGLTDRGTIAPGMRADLVVLDFATVGTAVSPSSLRALPQGIEQVLVNGRFVVRDGQPTHALPGMVGRRA